MTDPRWTDETLDLVAKRIWFLNTASMPEWWEPLHAITKSIYRTKAAALLTTMAEAGLLISPEVREIIEAEGDRR